jgi:hypothetical protein
MRVSKRVLGGSALLLFVLATAIGMLVRADEIHEIAVEKGSIEAVAVAPGGEGVAAGIAAEGWLGYQVRWWNWKGRSGSWNAPNEAIRINALAFDADRALLVGDSRDSRIAYMQWWKLAPDGTVVADCIGYPLGQFTKRGVGAIRGVHSFAVLPDGKIVTGGVDAALGVWDGCEPTWLNREQCCYAERAITVTADRDGFITSGEGGAWRGDEHGYELLGRRRWSPSPWAPAVVEARLVAPGSHADGEDCSAIVDADGQVAVSGTRSWNIGIDRRIWTLREDEKPWSRLAAASDCTALVIATDRRLLWMKSP